MGSIANVFGKFDIVFSKLEMLVEIINLAQI